MIDSFIHIPLRFIPDASLEHRQAEAELGDDVENAQASVANADGYVVGHPVQVGSLHSVGAEEARGNVASMHGSRGAGSVQGQWTVRGILLVLAFAASLHGGAKLGEALATAALIFFGEGGSQLAGTLSNGTLPTPSLSFLRSARVRLDIMSMLYERQLYAGWAFLRNLMVCASPQLGRNYLCGREYRIRLPRDAWRLPEVRARLNLNDHFESRVIPLSTVGSGRASGVKKSTNVAACYLMETENREQFDELRCSVCGITTDQGAEKGLADETVRIISGYRDTLTTGWAKDFLWPRALLVLVHVHILYNALQEACIGVPGADEFFEQLKTLCSFLSNVQLRRKFQAVCLVGQRCCKQFDHFPRTHVDWRWEFLGPALSRILPLIPFLVQFFNVDEMLRSENGKSENGLIRDVALVLASAPVFEARAEIFCLFAGVVERFASKLEGCMCHSDILRSGESYAARMKRIRSDTGANNCL